MMAYDGIIALSRNSDVQPPYTQRHIQLLLAILPQHRPSTYAKYVCVCVLHTISDIVCVFLVPMVLKVITIINSKN